MQNNNECLIKIILIVIIFILVLNNNNKTIQNFGNKITSGYINTILIVVIIGLILTENIQIGFYLAIIYLFLLIKYNKK